MSVTAMAWAWTINGLGPDPKFVLMALADQADDTGYCWPSQKLIAQRVEMGERTVRRHIRALREAGLVTLKVRSSTSGRRSNGYYLHVGAKVERAEEPEESLGSRQEANLAGCGEPVDNSSVDNSVEVADSVGIPAKGQSGRLRKRPDWPVAQEASSGRSLEASVGLLQYRGKNHQLNHQTVPDPVPHQLGDELAPVGSGQVGSGVGDGEDALASAASPASATARRQGGGSDVEIIASCLPAWMHPMDAPGAAQVAGLLRERLAAGWTPAQVAALMDAPPPAGGARRLSALVAYRIEANVNAALAPARLARPDTDAQEAADRQRARRSEALAGTSHAADPAWDAALETARQAMPDASWVELAVEARRLLAARRPSSPQPSDAAREGPPGRAA